MCQQSWRSDQFFVLGIELLKPCVAGHHLSCRTREKRSPVQDVWVNLGVGSSAVTAHSRGARQSA